MLYELGTSTSTFNTQINCTDIIASGKVTCVSLIQTSDKRIKENIVDADLVQIQSVFDKVDVKMYNRTDIEGSRIGFIAQDFVNTLPGEFSNIAIETYHTGNPLWGLDYFRLTTILWSVCKQQQKQIDDLTARMGPYI